MLHLRPGTFLSRKHDNLSGPVNRFEMVVHFHETQYKNFKKLLSSLSV